MPDDGRLTPFPQRWAGAGIEAALLPTGGPVHGTLAGLLGVRADALVPVRGVGGKPGLSSPDGAAYSLAHRGGLTLVGAGWHRAVGVDLECVRPDLDTDAIAAALFAPEEAARLRELGAHERARQFTAAWTVKEAVLKATGQGIVAGLAWPVVPIPVGAAFTLAGFAIDLRAGSLGHEAAYACLASGAD